MTTHIFDTHESIKELIAAGLPEKHAEAIVRLQVKVINHNSATKPDYALTDYALTKKDLRLMEKDLVFIFGAMLVATVGIILAGMSIMLNNISVVAP